MSKVCIVVEYRDVCNNEGMSFQENKAITGNRTIAENLIEAYKNELVESTCASGGIATDFTVVGGDVTVLIEYHEGCITYKTEYSWSIEEHDIIES